LIDTIIIISWLIIAGASFIGELLIPQFFLLWFGLGAIAALISHFMGVAYAYQWVVFCLCSGIGLLSTRTFAKLILKGEPKKSAVYEMVGKEGKVTRKIDNISGMGQVQIWGNLWRAISIDESTIEEGALVKVMAIEGVSLVVKKI
jgi:membrane protein implicated in regulation of membrane protease activity